MKGLIVFWTCILLVACTPVSPPAEVAQKPAEPVVQPVVKEHVELHNGEPATRTVKQTGSLGTFVYGLSEDNRILRVEKTGALWEYRYLNDKLIEIKGPQNFEFFYDQGRLSSVDSGATKVFFDYDVKGRLSEVRGFKETLYVAYDSWDRLRSVKRNVVEMSFDYDDNGKIKLISKGPVETKVVYDDKNRVRNFDADDTKFIIGYWRDDKVVSFTGKTFGQGLMLSYGPDYPPFEAKLIYAEDDSIFTSAYTDTLYKVVDDYLYCKYVRRLKDVSFDGISYAFFVNYYHKGLPEYLAMQFACVPYES